MLTIVHSQHLLRLISPLIHFTTVSCGLSTSTALLFENDNDLSDLNSWHSLIIFSRAFCWGCFDMISSMICSNSSCSSSGKSDLAVFSQMCAVFVIVFLVPFAQCNFTRSLMSRSLLGSEYTVASAPVLQVIMFQEYPVAHHLHNVRECLLLCVICDSEPRHCLFKLANPRLPKG